MTITWELFKTKDSTIRIKLQKFLNYVAIVWLSFCLFVGSFTGLLYVNPAVFASYPKLKIFNEFLMCYGLVNLVINWYFTVFTDTTVSSSSDNDVKLSEFDYAQSYCDICRLVKPFRAHHCKVCDRCIADRDHHCFFVAVCVAERNQKYFIVFTFWMAFGMTYAGLIMFFYFFNPEWRSQFLGIYDYILQPVLLVRCSMGLIPFYEFIMIWVFHSLLAGIFIACALFGSQINLVINGLTSYEKKKGIKSPITPFNSKWERLRKTFGPNWILRFLFPFDVLQKYYVKNE